MHPSPPATRIAARALHAVLTGLQSTEIQETPSDATDIASGLGTPKEPPDPLLTRRPAYAVLLKQNRQREAEAYVQRLLDDAPSDADAWCLKAGSDGARGDFEKATRYYDHALSIDPQHVEALVWRGVLAYTTDQTNSAIEFFRRALKQDPDHARACFYLGLAYTRTSPEQAATYFRRAADRFPGYVDAHHELAKLFLSINEPEQAAEACRIAIGFEQDNAEAHFHLGVSHVMQRQFDKAVTSFDDAIRLQPEFAEAHLACSDAWQQQGEIASAILHLRRAIELRPEWFDPTAKLAWLLATGNDENLRDGKEAVRLALKCLQQVESYQTLDILAAAYAEAGEYESAVKRQKQAVAQAPGEAKTSLESRLEQYNNRQPHRR
jgi:tetratricopeptide (TPR) repeat protein